MIKKCYLIQQALNLFTVDVSYFQQDFVLTIHSTKTITVEENDSINAGRFVDTDCPRQRRTPGTCIHAAVIHFK